MKFYVFCTFCNFILATLTFPSHYLSYLNLFRVKNLRLRRLSYEENAVWKFPLKKVKIFPISPPEPKTRGYASEWPTYNISNFAVSRCWKFEIKRNFL